MKARYLTFLTLTLLLFLSAAGAAAEPAEMKLSHPPGTYIQDIWLYIGADGSESPGVGAADQPAEYMYRFGEGRWTRVQGPLLLSAAPGEIRRHLIEVGRTRHLDSTDSTESSESTPEDSVRLEYHIHRRSPSTPRPLTAPGMYTESIHVDFSETQNTRTTYSLDGITAVYDGSPVRIAVEQGGYRRAELITQSIDSFGRVSEPGIFTYIIDRREQTNQGSEPGFVGDLPRPDLSLFSPPWFTPELETEPADSRLLIVAKAPAGTRLRYTLDDSTPSSSSALVPESGYFTTAAPTTRFRAEVPPLRVRAETADGRLGPESVLVLPGTRPAVPVVTENRSKPGVLVLTPELTDDALTANFRFELASDGQTAPPAGPDSPRLLPGTHIFVAPGESRDISYTVALINDDGISSEPLVRAPATLSYPVPAAPEIQVAADGTVQIRGRGTLFYRVQSYQPEGSGEAVLDSEEGWFQYAGQFRLPAIDGRRTPFRLMSYARNDLGIPSALSIREVTVDLRQPDLHLLEDLRPVERPYRDHARLRFTDFDPELQVRYEVYENGSTTPQHIGHTVPGGELLLSAPTSPRRVVYSIVLSALYPDSTREPYRTERAVVIDSREPGMPHISGVEANEVYFGVLWPDIRPAAGENVSLSLHRVENDETVQFVAKLLPHEQIQAERFGTGRFLLHVQAGTAAGITRDIARVPFELQEYRQPELQAQATVTHASATTAVFLSHGHGDRVTYALDFADSATRVQDLEFREYIMPLQLPGRSEHQQELARHEAPEELPDGPTAVPRRIVFATLPYSQEYSAVSTADWPLRDSPAFPELQHGGLYNHEIVLDPGSLSSSAQDDRGTLEHLSTLELRFELTSGSLASPAAAALPVSPVSPLLGSPLTVDPGEDAEQDYQLRAAWFAGTKRVSPELRLSFSIDRIPPDAPDVIGVENMAHLDGDLQISFSTTDSTDQVLYRVVEDTELLSAPPEIPTDAELTLYDGEELPFRIEGGEYRAISVEAFSRDEAGNISRESTVTRFVLDRAVVYLDANTSTQDSDRTGDPDRTGGRQTPHTELVAAFELAMTDNRSLIQVGAGSYELNQVIGPSLTPRGPAELRIEGVTSAHAGAEHQRPVIRVSSTGGFRVQDLPLSLENLAFETSPEMETALLRVTQSSSKLLLRNVQLHLNGAARGLDVAHGAVQVEDTVVVGRDMTAGPVLLLSGGDTRLHATSFEIAGSSGTYRAIEIGSGASFFAEDLSVAARPRSGLFTAVHSSGDVDLRDSHFDLSGGQGLIALRATDGVLTTHSSEFELYGAAEFAYGLFLGATVTNATGVHVRVAGSLDDAALVLERGELRVLNSRLELAEGRGRSTAFRLSGGTAELSSVDLVYHRIAAPGRFQARPAEDTAVAIDAAGKDMLSFEGLRIAGFPILLRPPRIPGVLRAPASVRSPDELKAYFGTERAVNLQVYEDSSQVSW